MEIRKAKPGNKPYKMADGGGLHLYVTPTGGKLWRYRYQYGGKEKLLSIGPYPSIALAVARETRDNAKADLREGRDPSLQKKLHKLKGTRRGTETFEAIAREWHMMNKPTWSENHARDVLHTLERDMFPYIGAIPIREISAPDVLGALRMIEDRDANETARRVRQRTSAVFVYAIASGQADTDPAAIVKGAMAPVKRGRKPAITDLNEAREMLRKAEEEPAHPVTKLALRLLALTVMRPGALIGTPWEEFGKLDNVAPVWQVPAARMKMMNRLDVAQEQFLGAPAILIFLFQPALARHFQHQVRKQVQR